MKGVATCTCFGLLLTSLGTLSGCADNESMLFIRGVMAVDSETCVLTYEPGALLLNRGTYDVGFGNAYYASLLVGNQLASEGDKTRSRTETSNIALEGAEVRLLNPDNSVARRTFTAPGAGFIQVGSGQDTGYGGITVVVVPASSGEDALNNTNMNGDYVIAEIRVFGKTLGGQVVESGLFKFPISVCRGCLVRFPTDSLNTDGTCRPAEDADVKQPCRLGQDEYVSCSVCFGSYDICREAP